MDNATESQSRHSYTVPTQPPATWAPTTWSWTASSSVQHPDSHLLPDDPWKDVHLDAREALGPPAAGPVLRPHPNSMFSPAAAPVLRPHAYSRSIFLQGPPAAGPVLHPHAYSIPVLHPHAYSRSIFPQGPPAAGPVLHPHAYSIPVLHPHAYSIPVLRPHAYSMFSQVPAVAGPVLRPHTHSMFPQVPPIAGPVPRPQVYSASPTLPGNGFAAAPRIALRYKRNLCYFYRRGLCKHGADCKFAHGQKELQDFRPLKYRKDDCHFVLCNEICPWGEDCDFKH